MALQEQQQQATNETPEVASKHPPAEGAAEASNKDGGDGKRQDEKTNVNNEIDNIAQRVTNAHIHNTVEEADNHTKAEDSTVTNKSHVAQAGGKEEPVTKPRTDPAKEQSVCHNITRTESTV